MRIYKISIAEKKRFWQASINNLNKKQADNLFAVIQPEANGCIDLWEVISSPENEPLLKHIKKKEIEY